VIRLLVNQWMYGIIFLFYFINILSIIVIELLYILFGKFTVR